MSLTYDDLTQPLQDLGVDFSASFTHGVLFALNCSHQNRDKLAALFIETIADTSENKADEHTVLLDLIEQTLEDIDDILQQDPFQFEPILDKSNQLVESESIKDWASGLIFGIEQLKTKTLNPSAQYSKNSQEFLQDIESIALMPTLNENDQASESDLMEIEEYLRMGAIGLYFDNQTN